MAIETNFHILVQLPLLASLVLAGPAEEASASVPTRDLVSESSTVLVSSNPTANIESSVSPIPVFSGAQVVATPLPANGVAEENQEEEWDDDEEADAPPLIPGPVAPGPVNIGTRPVTPAEIEQLQQSQGQSQGQVQGQAQGQPEDRAQVQDQASSISSTTDVISVTTNPAGGGFLTDSFSESSTASVESSSADISTTTSTFTLTSKTTATSASKTSPAKPSGTAKSVASSEIERDSIFSLPWSLLLGSGILLGI